MIKIFARLNTDQKAALNCTASQNSQVSDALSKEHGGIWACVDGLRKCEILKFDDGLEYNGFVKDARFCSKIETLNI